MRRAGIRKPPPGWRSAPGFPVGVCGRVANRGGGETNRGRHRAGAGPAELADSEFNGGLALDDQQPARFGCQLGEALEALCGEYVVAERQAHRDERARVLSRPQEPALPVRQRLLSDACVPRVFGGPDDRLAAIGRQNLTPALPSIFALPAPLLSSSDVWHGIRA
jgi:hypothetical protein